MAADAASYHGTADASSNVAGQRAELRLCIRARLIATLTAACIGCPADSTRDEQPLATSSGGVAPSNAAEPPAPSQALPTTDTVVAEQKQSALPPRELHPKGGRSKCVEMYSYCTTTNGQRSCTSAPFALECGEEGELPSSRQLLRCVCP